MLVIVTVTSWHIVHNNGGMGDLGEILGDVWYLFTTTTTLEGERSSSAYDTGATSQYYLVFGAKNTTLLATSRSESYEE